MKTEGFVSIVRRCGRRWTVIRCEFVRFANAIRANFKPDAGLSGVVAFGSRWMNLWRSGRSGKIAILLAGFMLYGFLHVLFLSIGGDGDKWRAGSSGGWGGGKRTVRSAVIDECENGMRTSPSKSCESGPYGVPCFKYAKPSHRLPQDGRPVYFVMPFLSDVKEAFVYCSGGRQYAFPSAKDANGRKSVCKMIMNDYNQACAVMSAQNWLYKNFEAPLLSRRIDEQKSEMQAMKIRDKMWTLREEQADRESARILEMTPAQYKTYKKSDWQQVNPAGFQTLPRGNPNLFRDPSGNAHEIDSNGNKYWIDSNGIPHREI